MTRQFASAFSRIRGARAAWSAGTVSSAVIAMCVKRIFLSTRSSVPDTRTSSFDQVKRDALAITLKPSTKQSQTAAISSVSGDQ